MTTFLKFSLFLGAVSLFVTTNFRLTDGLVNTRALIGFSREVLLPLSIVGVSFPTLANNWDDRNRLAAEVWRTVDEYYIDRTFNNQDWFKIRQSLVRTHYNDDQELFSAIKTSLSKLGDRYTRFLTPTQYEALYRLTQSEFVGIGAELASNDHDEVVVQSVSENSPAAEASFRAGDVLMEVNGISVAGLSEDSVLELFSNQNGDKIRLKVRRPSSGEVFENTCVRKRVKVASVASEVIRINDGRTVGLIRIQSFTTETQPAVLQALQLFHQSDNPVSAIFIDLRNNPGGVLTAAVDSANLFLSPGKIVVFVATNRDLQARTTTATAIPSIAGSDIPDLSTPCFLVVDRQTASAAEVFVGGLQENLRATVVGVKTFGKGIIQSFQQLSKGGLAVTTARYETPLHHNIHKIGISPDLPFNCEEKSLKACLPSLLSRIKGLE